MAFMPGESPPSSAFPSKIPVVRGTSRARTRPHTATDGRTSFDRTPSPQPVPPSAPLSTTPPDNGPVYQPKLKPLHLAQASPGSNRKPPSLGGRVKSRSGQRATSQPQSTRSSPPENLSPLPSPLALQEPFSVSTGTVDQWGDDVVRSDGLIRDEVAPFQILSNDLLSSSGQIEPFTEQELARQMPLPTSRDPTSALEASPRTSGSDDMDSEPKAVESRQRTVSSGRALTTSSTRRSTSLSKPSPVNQTTPRTQKLPASKSTPITPKGTPNARSRNTSTPSRPSTTTTAPTSRTKPSPSTPAGTYRRPLAKSSPLSPHISANPQQDLDPHTPDGTYRLNMFGVGSIPPASVSPTKQELTNWDEVIIPTVRRNQKFNPLLEWDDSLSSSPTQSALSRHKERSRELAGRGSEDITTLSAEGVDPRAESQEVLKIEPEEMDPPAPGTIGYKTQALNATPPPSTSLPPSPRSSRRSTPTPSHGPQPPSSITYPPSPPTTASPPKPIDPTRPPAFPNTLQVAQAADGDTSYPVQLTKPPPATSVRSRVSIKRSSKGKDDEVKAGCCACVVM